MFTRGLILYNFINYIYVNTYLKVFHLKIDICIAYQEKIGQMIRGEVIKFLGLDVKW